MPFFLNKVFGHRKQDDARTTLLDGKYEAVEAFFKPKSRLKPADSAVVPHLTLQLPTKDKRTLGFEADPDLVDDAVIAAKRLAPSDTLMLVRACARTIAERGLETLGIMHPHWFASSPDVQRKLISLFLCSSPSAFQNELHSTRSPHDVAAVLRWGLRHLSIEHDQSGNQNADWAWYTAFFHAERQAAYPPKAFSELLLPRLPSSHTELLTATLDLIASLASHAEINGISGSKLSKCLGIWLLVATRAEESDDWNCFYARWERAGRILEHLFLARLREVSFGLRLPTRLQELIKHYPYHKGSPATEEELLPRPRFSTRQYDALCVRVESLLTHEGRHPKQHPVQLLFEAFQLPVDNPSDNAPIAFWNTLRATAAEDATPQGPEFTRIFVDETVQLLSLISADSNVASPILTSPIAKVVSRKRSSSFSKVLERALSKGDGSTSPTSPVVADWAQFSLTGFGDTPATQPLVPLAAHDDDVEVTQPRVSRKSSRRAKSRSRRRRSEERAPSDIAPSEHEPSIVETKLASVHVVQIDEAFIDFWSDAIADPISASWPTFLVCGLKDISTAEKPIRWLVIEQAYTHQQTLRSPSPDGRRGRSPRPSFKSDISAGFRINSMFSSARKRLSVFSKSATDLDPKKSGGKSPVTGELGHVLVEESSPFLAKRADGNAAVQATVTNGTTADVAGQVKVDEIPRTPIASISPIHLLSVVKEDSDSVVATKAPSVEPTPQSGDGTLEWQGGLPQTLGSVDPGTVNAPEQFANIIAVATDLAPAQTNDPLVITSGSTMEGGGSRQAEQPPRDVVVDTDVRPVPLPAEDDALPVQPLVESTHVDVISDARPVVPAVAVSFTAENVPEVAKPISPSAPVVAVGEEDPLGRTAEELHPGKQPSLKASASSTESVDQCDLASLSATENKVIDTETRAQPESNGGTSVVDGVEEAVKDISERTEIPSCAPEQQHVVIAGETADPGVYVDADARAGASQVAAAVNQSDFQETVLQPATADMATLGASSVGIISDNDTRVPWVPTETELAADQVAVEQEAPVGEAAEALQGDVSAGIMSAVQGSLDEVEAHAASDVVSTSRGHVLETRDGVPTPAQANAVLVDDTPAGVPSEECEAPPDADVAETENKDPDIPNGEVPTPIPVRAELPTQAVEEALSRASNGEEVIPALATVETGASKVEAAEESPETHADVPEGTLEETQTLEIAVGGAAPVGTDMDAESTENTQVVVGNEPEIATTVSASEPDPIPDSIPDPIPDPVVGQDDQDSGIGYTEQPSAPVAHSAEAPVSHTANEEPHGGGVVVAEPAQTSALVAPGGETRAGESVVSVPVVEESRAPFSVPVETEDLAVAPAAALDGTGDGDVPAELTFDPVEESVPAEP